VRQRGAVLGVVEVAPEARDVQPGEARDVADGLAVVDPGSGTVRGTVPVDRDGSGPVAVTVAGSTVLEQRGDEVVALR